MEDFNFPHIDLEAPIIKGLNGSEIGKYLQNSLLQKCIDVLTRKRDHWTSC